MGPQTVAMPGTALTWAVVAVSIVIAAMLAYEVATLDPPTWRWPAWPGQTIRFVYRWYPRIIVPSLIALGWLWS